MARQPTEKHRHKRRHKHKHEAADPEPQHKSSKHSHVHHKKPAKDTKDAPKQPEVVKKPSKSKKVDKHPAKQPEGVKKKSSKPKKTVSAAAVFKQAKQDEKKHKKHRKHKEPTPEPTLTDYLREDIQEGYQHARASIDQNLHTTFDVQHQDFIRQLTELRTADEAFFESIHNASVMLSTSLGEEQIETTFTRDGKRVTEVVEIGKRIELFKASIENDDGKLKGYWKAWDDLHDGYLELGIEVFGPEACGATAEDVPERGFLSEIEGMDTEHESKLNELADEVDDIAEQFLMKMRESEKELDATLRKQQAKLLQALIGTE